MMAVGVYMGVSTPPTIYMGVILKLRSSKIFLGLPVFPSKKTGRTVRKLQFLPVHQKVTLVTKYTT